MSDDAPLRVLLVAYHFPPAGGGGVQRPAKLVKYWMRNGVEVAVLAGPEDSAGVRDPGLLEELEPLPTIERVEDPGWVRRLTGLRRGSNRLANRALAGFTAAAQSLMAPDHVSGWRGPAIRRGTALAEKLRPNVLLVTAPPFSAYLVGAEIARRVRSPLVLDYRDPWSATYLPTKPRLAARLRNPTLERRTLRSAAGVIAAHRRVFRELDEAGAELPRLRLWVPNGYDPDDLPRDATESNTHFQLVYTGSFYGFRDPTSLLRAIDRLLRERTIDPARFRLVVAGATPGFARSLPTDSPVWSVLDYRGYLSHGESTALLCRGTVNLVLEGSTGKRNHHSPGKFYEALAAGRPVLLVCPDGVTTRLARACGGCAIVDPGNELAIREALADLYNRWESSAPMASPNDDRIGFYRRDHQARRLTRFLRRVASR